MKEIHSAVELRDHLQAGGSMHGLRLQSVDLTPLKALLRARTDFRGLVVLGGTVPPKLDRHLRKHGALLFPADPQIPVSPYRARLYHPSELYAGLSSPEGYAITPDARAYAWYRDPALRHDTYVTMVRAIHDDSMGDALDEALRGRRVVGVMGGHGWSRATPDYAAAAELGHALADAGLVVLTGGGPGAMEAANLGAFAHHLDQLPEALAVIEQVPSWSPEITPWARVALRARRMLGPGRDPHHEPRSIGVPTWFYGHEPPNVFCDGIAKYFSNAEREDGLIARANAGVVVLQGAAGTVQEVFQAVTPGYYASGESPIPPLVLVGVEHWTRTVPLWPTVRALAAGRPLAARVHLVDSVGDAVAIVLENESRVA